MFYVYTITKDIVMNVSSGQSEGSARNIYNIFTILQNLQLTYSLLTYLELNGKRSVKVNT